MQLNKFILNFFKHSCYLLITIDVNFDRNEKGNIQENQNRKTINEKVYEKIMDSKNKDRLLKWYNVFVTN